ncbi:hypothetical protein [Sporomusa carbonis]
MLKQIYQQKKEKKNDAANAAGKLRGNQGLRKLSKARKLSQSK